MFTSESRLERQFALKVSHIGGKAYKFVSPCNRGVPDRICVFPGGQIWFVELKTETGKLASEQCVQLAKLEALGFRVRVAVGKEGVDDVIQEMRASVVLEDEKTERRRFHAALDKYFGM